MPRCLVRYRILITNTDPRYADQGQRIASVEEVREPDEWGDPGLLLRRRLVSINGPDGPTMLYQLLRHAHLGWGYRLLDRVGPLKWG